MCGAAHCYNTLFSFSSVHLCPNLIEMKHTTYPLYLLRCAWGDVSPQGSLISNSLTICDDTVRFVRAMIFNITLALEVWYDISWIISSMDDSSGTPSVIQVHLPSPKTSSERGNACMSANSLTSTYITQMDALLHCEMADYCCTHLLNTFFNFHRGILFPHSHPSKIEHCRYLLLSYITFNRPFISFCHSY